MFFGAETLTKDMYSHFSGTFRNPQPLAFSQKYCRYKWEAHCGTNKKVVLRHKLEVYCGVSLSSRLRSQRGTALQMGGVLRYKFEVYCQYLSDKLYGLGVPEQCPISDLFSRVLFSFLSPLLAAPLPLLFSAPFRPCLPSKSAPFCRAKGTAQSLERGRFRMNLSTKFWKEMPSRNLHKKGQFLKFRCKFPQRGCCTS